MISLDQAVQLCVNRIVHKHQHRYYTRTVERAKLYEQLITGEDQLELLKQFFSTQSPEELKKISEVTHTITSSVCNALIVAFKKVLRSKPIVKKIDFQEFDEAKKAEVEAALAKYYAGSSLEFYIEKRFHDLTFLDPNAFIITEFESVTDLQKKAEPFPFEVTSAEAVNYERKNGILQFLLAETTDKGYLLRCYLENHAVVFKEVPKTSTTDFAENELFKFLYDNVRPVGSDINTPLQTLPVTCVTKDRQFEIQYFEHKQGRVPAQVVGYVPDKKTKGEIFVNPIHYGALPYLLKSITSVAEMDLTTRCHTFPQKFMYADGCSFDMNGVCNTSNQRIDQCSLCNKKGYLEHTSAKDVVRFKMPRDLAELIDLSKLIHYAYPPIEGIKFQNEYINELTQKCYKAVFNSEVFSKDEVQKTATGANLDLQNAYDPMSDYASKKSDFWMRTVVMVAAILDYRDCIAQEKYPNDFKLKQVTELLYDLKLANESAAPSFVIKEINRDIAAQLYQDRPFEMLKYEVMQKLAPFAGKNKEQIVMGLNAGFGTKTDAVLWMYFDQFMEELEELTLGDKSDPFADLLEFMDNAEEFKSKLAVANKAKLIWFYDLPFNLQSTLLYAKAGSKQAEIEDEQPAAVSFGEDQGGSDLGKLPLALQQLGLARQRAVDVGDNALAEQLGNAMDELTRQVNA